MRETAIEYGKKFLNYLGLIVFGSAFTGIIILGYFGVYPPDFLTAYGTLLLVIVTFGYVLQNSQMLQQMREERNLNEQTLREMQKGPRIMVISHGIDEVLSELEDDREKWEELEPVIECMPVEERLPFPKLLRFNLPDEGTLGDIEANYTGFMDTIERYEGIRSEYVDKWSSLQSDLTEFIDDEWALEMASNPSEEISEMVEMTGKESAVELINQHDSKLAEFVLRLGPEKRRASRTPESLAEILGWSLIQLRDHEKFEDRIEELERLLNRLKSLNEELAEGLGSARREFKEEYDIKEPEISESRRVIEERERQRSRRMMSRIR